MNDYIKRAKLIISRYNLDQYVNILLKYWEEYPPVLGHGFSHALSVAVEAYVIGILNNYQNPEDLFVGGLFHDIYRPVSEGTGNEDQTKGADITNRILDKRGIPKPLINKIAAMILSHDSWRNQNNPPQFDLLISIADKICMDDHHINAYIWAVNQYYIDQGKDAIMTSHLTNIHLWLKYQLRAWEIFNRYRNSVHGIDKAIRSYIRASESVFKKYENDPENKNYFNYFDNSAKEMTQREKKTIGAFLVDPERINHIIKYSFK